MRQRNLLTTCILTIITCGIYGIYLQVSLPSEYASELGERRNAVLDVILIIFTCGIYGVYLNYLTGVYINRVAELKNEPVDDLSIIAIILSVLGIISFFLGGSLLILILFQEKMNSLVTMPSNTINTNSENLF